MSRWETPDSRLSDLYSNFDKEVSVLYLTWQQMFKAEKKEKKVYSSWTWALIINALPMGGKDSFLSGMYTHAMRVEPFLKLGPCLELQPLKNMFYITF